MRIFAFLTKDVRVRSLGNSKSDKIRLDAKFGINILSHIRPLEIEQIISFKKNLGNSEVKNEKKNT
jgi:hypothetical protein